MALHKIVRDGNRLEVVRPTGFVAEQWRERQHLQPLLRDNPGSIDPGLFIVSEEFSSWEDSSRSIDLLGLDKEGNLVVIELKRIEEGGHMELQSIRYAAMVSAMDFEGVVRAHEAFLDKQGKESSTARSELMSFLGLGESSDAVISSTPRIVLVAPSFSREITTTVLWLNDQGLNIRCVEANLYNIDGALYLDISQVIPLPSASDYQVRIREKTAKVQREASAKRRERTIEILTTNGVLEVGTRLYLIEVPRAGLEIDDEKARHATFEGKSPKPVRWDYDGELYSLSGLCKAMCEKFGGELGSGAFPGPDFWAVEGDTTSLSKRALELATREPAE